MPVKFDFKEEYNRSGVVSDPDAKYMGVKCSFEFINLETQKPIFVAMNAIPEGSEEIGIYLRSTLVDENGRVWALFNSDVEGIGKVGVGNEDDDPAEIVNLLSKRDYLNSDIVQYNGYKYHFMHGEMTEISPKESINVTAVFFAAEWDSKKQSKVFQMASEIVVGIPKSDTKKFYKLYNLTFDNINLTAKQSLPTKKS